jgi:hypothetical protein
MDARPLTTPDTSPTETAIAGEGLGGSRMPIHRTATDAAIVSPIARRTGLGGKLVRIISPIGMPITNPGARRRTARQSQSFDASRSPAAPTMTWSAMTNGTTFAGGNARLSNGTAAKPNPNPVNPRSNDAARTPTKAITRVRGIEPKQNGGKWTKKRLLHAPQAQFSFEPSRSVPQVSISCPPLWQAFVRQPT